MIKFFRYYLVSVLMILLTLGFAYGQDHDMMDDAYELSSIDAYCSGVGSYFTTDGATPDGVKPSKWSNGPNSNVWFKFRATSGEVSILLTPSGMKYPKLSLHKDDGSYSEVVSVSDDGVSIPVGLSSSSLIVGEWYLINVSNGPNSGHSGGFQLCVDDEVSSDYVQGAIELSHASNNCSGLKAYTTQIGTPDGDKPTKWGNGPNANVWFKFQATSSEVSLNLNVDGIEGDLKYPKLAIYGPDYGELVSVSDDGVKEDIGLSRIGLSIGEWYYISVDNGVQQGHRGTFTLCIDDEASYDFRSRALLLSNLNNYCSGLKEYSTYVGTPDGDKPSGWAKVPAANVWFKFVAIGTEATFEVKVDGAEGTMLYPRMALYDAGNNYLSSVDDSGSKTDVSLTYNGLTVGDEYYLSVDNGANQGQRGTFTLCVDNPGSGGPVTPPAPTGFAATANGTDQIDLSWTDVVGETGYAIWRSTNGTDFSPLIETLGVDVTSYVDIGLSSNTPYYYQIKSLNGDVGSTFTPPVVATTALLPPTDFTANGSYGNRVQLSWNAPSAPVDSYEVSRSLSGANDYNQMFMVNTTNYSDDRDIIEGTGYDYRVRSKKGLGTYSAYVLLSVVTASIDNDLDGFNEQEGDCDDGDASIYPGAIDIPDDGIDQDCDGSDVISGGDGSGAIRKVLININSNISTQASGFWNNLTANYAESNTERANLIDDEGVGTGVTMTLETAWHGRSTIDGMRTAGAILYPDNVMRSFFRVRNGSEYILFSDLDPSIRYTFRMMSSYNNRGTSDKHSNTLFEIEYNGLSELVTEENNVDYLAEFVNVQPEPDGTIRLKVTNGTADRDGYLNALEIEYREGGTPVRAFAPTGFTASVGGRGQIDLSWDDQGNETGYEIRRSQTAGGTNDPFVTLSADVTSYSDTGLPSDISYYYQIRAIDDMGPSAYSSEIDISFASYDFIDEAHELTDLNSWCSSSAGYTNVNASSDGATNTCSVSSPHSNVWFKFQALGESVTVDLKSGGGFGTLSRGSLVLWNNRFESVTCGNDVGGNVTLSLTDLIPGTNYYISIGNYESNAAYQGSFTLCINNPMDSDVIPVNYQVKGLYNGTITSMVWRTDQPYQVSDGDYEDDGWGAYAFEYDNKYQLTEALWGAKSGLGLNFNSNRYRLTGLSYDANGNIETLRRYNTAGQQKDHFSYDYNPDPGLQQNNQLNTVAGYSSYHYNSMGQLTHEDANEGNDKFVEYDVSGKVIGVYGSGTVNADGSTTFSDLKVSYTYDDRGFRLMKRDEETGHETWYIRDAAGRVLSIYEKDNPTAVAVKTETPIYGSGKLGVFYPQQDGTTAYELTDHLGNVRAVMKRQHVTFTATMEDTGADDMSNPRVEEMNYFTNLFETGKDDASRNHTDYADASYSSYLYWGGTDFMTTQATGASIGLKVEANDIINLQSWVQYQDNASSYSRDLTLASLIGQLTGTFSGALAADAAPLINDMIGAADVALLSSKTGDDQVPHAYLNYVLFSDAFVLLDAGAKRMSAAASGAAHEQLKFNSPIEVTQDGYLFVWVSNESASTQVWFDDLSVDIERDVVTQSTDYYPYGSVARRFNTPNFNFEGTGFDKKANFGQYYRYGYQGEFAEEDSETGWNSFELRQYDATIGRWNSVDPYKQHQSPYLAMGNSPVNSIDPDGGLDWVQGEDGIYWDPNATSQETTKKGETYLGKNLTFEFISFIDADLWDGPLGGFTAGEKLISTVELISHTGENNELISVDLISSYVVNATGGVFQGRDYFPGQQNKSVDIKSFIGTATFEQHAMVNGFEVFGLDLMGYDPVNIAQKITFGLSGNNLSISAGTDIFPSATLSVNGIELFHYAQPSFKATHGRNSSFVDDGRGGVGVETTPKRPAPRTINRYNK